MGAKRASESEQQTADKQHQRVGAGRETKRNGMLDMGRLGILETTSPTDSQASQPVSSIRPSQGLITEPAVSPVPFQ